MNVLLSYLIVSFFAQITNGEVLPSPAIRGTNAVGTVGSPPVLPATSPAIPPSNLLGPLSNGSATGGVGYSPLLPNQSNVVAPPPQTKVGWGTDPENLFCLIIQISPDAIASFAQGQNGQELPVNIPPEFRDRFQRVVIRVGTGEVERNPPNPASFSSTRNNSPAMITNLDNRSGFENRTPVSIDRSTDLMLAGQQTGSPNAALNPLPPQLNSGSGFGSSNTGAQTSGPNPFDRNSNAMNVSPSFMDPNGRLVSAPTQAGSGFGTADKEVFPPNSVARQDDFLTKQPLRSSALNILRPNATNGYPATNNGGYATSTNPNVNARGIAPPPYLASNPNQPPQNGFNDATNPTGQSNFPVPQYQLQNTYPNPNPNSVVPYTVPNVAQNPYANLGPPNANSNLLPGYQTAQIPSNPLGGTPPHGTDLNEPNLAPRNNLIQFLLLFSIIGNVYLGCWMGYLRQRYRELLCNMRGIPVTDLDA